jgi:hypothetical protein
MRIWPKPSSESERGSLKIVIEDEARQVDPDQIKSRELDDIRPGGLGVHIIRQVMDEVTYERREGAGMRLTMAKSVKHTVPPEQPGMAAGGNT